MSARSHRTATRDDDDDDGRPARRAADGKEHSDLIELGINHLIAENPAKYDPRVPLDKARVALAALEAVLDTVPTQRWRDAESEAYQQFSTPPHYAYVAAWVANLTAGDVVVEPSAGLGGLAVFAANARATVYVNELSARRAHLLRALPFEAIYQINAEHLHSALPPEILPTVVVMNPPFSATAGRMGDKKVTGAGAQHVEQALKRLRAGGRLVAILGRGMAPDRPTFAGWWSRVREQYTVRANVGIPGATYRKYGTTFETRLIVIDKTGPTAAPVLDGTAASLADALTMLSPARDARGSRPAVTRRVAVPASPFDFGSLEPAAEPATEQAAPEPDADDAAEVARATRRLGGGRGGPIEPDAARRYNARLDAVLAETTEATWDDAYCINLPNRRTLWQNVRAIDPSFPDSKLDKAPWPRVPANDLVRAAMRAAGALDEPETAAVEQAAAAVAEMTDAVFEAYHPQRLRIPGARPHPTPLVQSAAMASVMPPAPEYQPAIPRDLIEQGVLSEAQLEAVVYAGQAFRDYLEPQTVTEPDGVTTKEVAFRKGFFIGDGTGVGKGRELAGLILDSFNRGQTKALWVSKTPKLLVDARRDWKVLGGDESDVFDLRKYRPGEAIRRESGILFTTYASLKSGRMHFGQGDPECKSRLRQIIAWLGDSFEGVIAFDESHCMKNAASVEK